MKTITYKTLVVIFGMFLLTNCTEQQTEDHREHEEAKKEDEVHLLQKQMDVMNIQLGHFQEINLSTTVKANGQLELPPRNKASLSTMMSGRVKDVFVIEGDHVTKGQTLALLEHPDFIQMQQEYTESRSKLNFLKKDYQRKKQLFQDSISSARNFQQAEAKYQAALAKVNSFKAKLNLLSIDISAVEKGQIFSNIPIKSPISGYVRLVEVNIGTFVEPQQEMFEIVDIEHIHIDLMIYEKDISKIKEGQNVIFSLATKPDTIYEGSIFAVGKAFENDIKAVIVHAKIENKSGNLLPGMYVDARIVIDQRKVIALPDEAIVTDAGLSYIFIQKVERTREQNPDAKQIGKEQQHNEHAHLSRKHRDSEKGHNHNEEKQNHDNEYIFKKIEVNTGASDIGFTEVVPAQSIPENATVVIKGAYYLLAEMKKGEGGGHHH